MQPRPIPTLTTKQIGRFWQKIIRSESVDDCWLWQGTTTKGINGGGAYGLWALGGYNLRPHRVAYTLMVGVIPDGLTMDHLCGRTLCCNPSHLEPVTQSENTRRGIQANWKPFCKYGHPIQFKQKCRECAKRYSRRYREQYPERCRETRRKSYEKMKSPHSSAASWGVANGGLCAS